MYNKIVRSNLETGRVTTLLIDATHNRSTVLARWCQCVCTFIYDSLGPSFSPPQTVARSVQPFLLTLRFLILPTPLPKMPYCVELWTPSKILFLELSRPTIPNGISIESAVFPEYMLVTNGETNRPTDRTNTNLDR